MSFFTESKGAQDNPDCFVPLEFFHESSDVNKADVLILLFLQMLIC